MPVKSKNNTSSKKKATTKKSTAKKTTKKKRKSNLSTDYNFSEELILDLTNQKKFIKKVKWSEDKSDVRKTKEWLEFKVFMKHKQNGKDPISQKPLNNTANLHHMDYHEENYGNFNDNNFVLLNQMDHKLIHLIAQISKNVGGFDTFVENIRPYIEKTMELNKDIKTFPLAH